MMTVTPMHTGDEGGSNSHCRTAPTTTSLRALEGGVVFGARFTKTLATLPARSINTVPTHNPCPTIPGGSDASDGRTYRVRFGALWVRSTRTASTLYRVRASDWQAVDAIAPTRPAPFRPPPCASERAGGDNASNAMHAAAIVRALGTKPMNDLIIGHSATAAEGFTPRGNIPDAAADPSTPENGLSLWREHVASRFDRNAASVDEVRIRLTEL